jgi:hypothetical protein
MRGIGTGRWSFECMDILQIAKGRSVIIYGAHLVAVELYRYLADGLSEFDFEGFAVTSMEGNPEYIEGHLVRCIQEYVPLDGKVVFVAMPQKYHAEVTEYVHGQGFKNVYTISQEQMENEKGGWILAKMSADHDYELRESIYDKSWLDIREKCTVDSDIYLKFPTLFYKDWDYIYVQIKGKDLFSEYENRCGEYLSLYNLKQGELLASDDIKNVVKIYMAFSQWDSANATKQTLSPWIVPIQAGSILTDKKSDSLLDEMGESISAQNRGLAEMTVAYWVWRNEHTAEYKGLCHYRRHFVMDVDVVGKLKANNVDVVLTIPRYVPGGVGEMFLAETPVKQFVYDTMTASVEYLYPDEKELFLNFLRGEFYHPNNMVVARSNIYDKYCEWLFPVIFRMREIDLKENYGHETDRHLAYASELLTSYYFMSHGKNYKTVVTDYRFVV